jgi:hypothetical protein
MHRSIVFPSSPHGVRFVDSGCLLSYGAKSTQQVEGALPPISNAF